MNAYDFDLNDPVFSMKGPILQVNNEAKKCFTCVKDMSKAKSV